MSNLTFTKMHGCGNDYIYINCFEQQIDNAPELATTLSNRNFGIGSDGLILICPTDEGDAEMVMYNPDGSTSEMCGNGLRCVAKYIYDHGIASTKELSLKTGAGIKKATITEVVDHKASLITINMGQPILPGRDIPTVWNESQIINKSITIEDRSFDITCVSMGNPHCVIYVDDVHNFPVEKYGPLIEHAPFFPNRVNVEFVEIVSPKEVIQRTWERGTGETLACGTGASAVCVAGVLTGNTVNTILVHLTGGDLSLSYIENEGVIMTGPAVEVFSGTLSQ